jgi:acetyl esterase/lipase
VKPQPGRPAKQGSERPESDAEQAAVGLPWNAPGTAPLTGRVGPSAGAKRPFNRTHLGQRPRPAFNRRMKTSAHTLRALVRAALSASSIALGTAASAATGCTPLGPADKLAERFVKLGQDLLMAQDLCYAQGLHWREADPLDSRRNVTLDQRFDIYRSQRAPLTQALPLVIWAHPNGQSEQLGPERLKTLVGQAAHAGFTFMSIEFRHSVASQLAATEPPTPPRLDIPHTDIARAVQWARSRAQQLGVDPENVFLLGQSRGSLAVLSALMPDQRDDTSGTDYLRASSRVNAVFAVQAQTSYEHAQVRDNFIAAQDWPRFDDPLHGYPWFRDPGSAIDEVSDNAPPVMLRYDRQPTDDQRVVPLGMREADGSCPARPDVPGCFDVHHPNFGLALRQAFDRHPAIADRLVVQYGVPGTPRFFDGYACFFAAHLVGAAAAGPDTAAACAGGVGAPPVSAARR